MNVLVTGAGRGFGRGAALALAAAGHHVGLVARTASELDEVASAIGSTGGTAATVSADVRELDEVQRCFAEVGDQLGDIEALAHIAGGESSMGLVTEVPWEQWRVPFDNDVAATHHVANAALAAGASSIVICSSMAALSMTPLVSAYCTGALGRLAIAESLRKETEPRGVTVHSILPVLSPHGGVGRRSFATFAAHAGVTEDEVIAARVTDPQLTADTFGEGIADLIDRRPGGAWKVDADGLHEIPLADLAATAHTVG